MAKLCKQQMSQHPQLCNSMSRAHTFLTSNLGFLATPSSILTSTIFVDLYHSSCYVLPIYIRVAGIVVVVDGDMGW
jgi:hypothetical protein